MSEAATGLFICAASPKHGKSVFLDLLKKNLEHEVKAGEAATLCNEQPSTTEAAS